MSIEQIANYFVSFFRQGYRIEIFHELFDVRTISIEVGNLMPIITKGKHDIINDFFENPEKVNGENFSIIAQGHTVITNSTVPSTYGN